LSRLPLAVALVLSALPLLARADDAQDLWMQRCKGCHGVDGRAQTTIGLKEHVGDFTSAGWQDSRTDPEILEVITNGSRKPESKMKPFREKLYPEDIQLLVGYVRGLGGRTAGPLPPSPPPASPPPPPALSDTAAPAEGSHTVLWLTGGAILIAGVIGAVALRRRPP
jgi:cytochrome c6